MNNVGFLKINGNTIDDIIDLSVEESQKHLIANNAEWLAEASFNDDSVSYGIYLDDKPAGSSLLSIQDYSTSSMSTFKRIICTCGAS